ncbi:general odorant-binding protein 56d-like [Topomyia yanbarensis]|uniref:general odorant-binding protein 56d-like n=1 Tax=Topomyia yanbarensis TaxID=2498891 RepID=UPI00273B14D5|nr:general odorant-binding protein 56d-like [Topomyia yanbarensis]
MYSIFIVLCVVFTSGRIEAYTLQQRQQGDLFALECLTETGVNPASIALLKVGDFSANDQRAKCFVRCFFQKEGFMNGDGDFLTDSVIEALSSDFEREKVKKVVSSCDAKGKDACDTAFLMYECLYKNRENL